MPELPEVETVVRGLRVSLPGRTFLEVRLGKTDFIDDPHALAEHLPGKRIASVTRMGKFISLQLVPGETVDRALERSPNLDDRIIESLSVAADGRVVQQIYA